MIFVIKTCISFVFFYIFLSYPINNKPIFLYMHEHTSAATGIIYKNFTHLKNELSEDIVKPSVQKIETSIYKKVDSVSTKLSGMKKQKKAFNQIKHRAVELNKKFSRHSENSHHDNHHYEDREKLLELLE